jgi:rhomboid protease GluP
MIAIYIVSTIAGFAASSLWNPGLSVGASAGICGLIGAMISAGIQHRSALGDAIRSMYTRWLLYILMFGVLMPGIDNAAHIGGLAGGFGVAWIAGLPSLGHHWREKIWTVAMYACLVLTAFSFIEMFLTFRRYTSGPLSL